MAEAAEDASQAARASRVQHPGPLLRQLADGRMGGKLVATCRPAEALLQMEYAAATCQQAQPRLRVAHTRAPRLLLSSGHRREEKPLGLTDSTLSATIPSRFDLVSYDRTCADSGTAKTRLRPQEADLVAGQAGPAQAGPG